MKASIGVALWVLVASACACPPSKALAASPDAGAPLSLRSVPRLRSDAALEQVNGRWVAATADDQLHTFEDDEGTVSPSAERIVELIDGRRTVAQIAHQLTEEFEVGRAQAEADTLDFIGLLGRKRLLVW